MAMQAEFRQRLLEHFQALLTPERRQRIDDVLEQRTRHVVLVLENAFRAHNISAVLRSCDAFGVQDVHVIDPQRDFDVARDIALGADRWLTVRRYHDADGPAAACLDALRADGYRLLVTRHGPQAQRLDDVDLSHKTALVMGNEHAGVSNTLTAAAHDVVGIPTCGFVECLNLSVAAALCLYELTSRLRRSEIEWRLTKAERDRLRFQWTRQSIRHAREIEERIHRLHRPADCGAS
jgi:tRNA (guanosine-2'-O-)-methyltransferase